ncbi:MAG: asparagine synthase (glutamine-hydrolyzing) [Xanthomonadales bacterium]|nr:asparagine synthase (glutamine-hydrolyzing) [Xanthomonadales bacterium]
MCGFAGLINLAGLSGDATERHRALAAMGAQLARRGPDDEQFYDDGFLSLVFRRLSIIDLAGGQQPIWNEDHSILSVVNGEIYNHQDIRERLKDRHQFASRSDSEVVVHLYEEGQDELLSQLNGMYALLIWDTRERKLLLARDRLGIKPLFYAETPKGLLFGSELKALLAHPYCPREMNWGDFDSSWGIANPLHTNVRGVKQLGGGHVLGLVSGSPPLVKPYWSVQDYFHQPGEDAVVDPAWWSERYGELLQDSVTRQLMSDVPLGLFLSGGIDSSLLAAMAAKAAQELHCFTVVEDSTLQAGDVEQSVILAERLGFHHHPVHYNVATLLDQLQFNLAAFEFLVWAMERPAFKVEWLLKLELHRYAKTALPGLKVILLGQGADEFAGGYSRSMGNESQDWQHYSSRITATHTAMQRIDMQIPAYLRASLNDRYPPLVDKVPHSAFHREMIFRGGLLQRYNLWHEDRSSSSQGIEARVPFLDHRLVELLAAVPPELHAGLFYDKRIVREQLAKVAPFYPPDKQKVKFSSTGKGNSIKDLRKDIVRRIYPEFRDKYLTSPDAIFSRDKLDTHQQFLMQDPTASNRDVKDMLECMAIAVFDRYCREMSLAPAPSIDEKPSPLQLWSPPTRQQPTTSSEWSMELSL